ncbi:MAG: FlgD immunoglobulin-like domain containing protein, partial [Elusimicrobiota bacterium]
APVPPPGPSCALYTYPNPFSPENGTAKLHWELPEDAAVTLSLYDQLGEKVREWSFTQGGSGGQQGVHEASWDGAGSHGPVRQGMYYLLMEAEPIACRKVYRVGVTR